MARYIPKHMRKRPLREHRRVTGIAAVLVAGVAGLSGSFGYTPGAQAIDPSKPLAAQVQALHSAAGIFPVRARPINPAPISSAINVNEASLPLFVSIPAIGANSELVELGLEADGSLQVPVDFNQAGWFRDGSVPGEKGPAVIAGHLDSVLGPAIFSKLSLLKPGDVVRILRKDSKVLTFHVTRIDNFPKEYFPSDQVYGPTDVSELRLITCGGSFNSKAHSYNGNTVVYALLDSTPT